MARFTMTVTLGEFERQLQPLLTGWAVEQRAHGWRLERRERSVDISCRQLPALRLGALELPRLDASITFTGGGAEQDADFIDDFLRYFRRGGG